MRFLNNQRLAEIAGVNYDSVLIKPGPIVYSRTHLIESQFPKLASFGPCVLVTSFSDDSVTDKMAEALPPNVIRWFSNNVMTDNHRVEAVPIGLRFSDGIDYQMTWAMSQGRLPERNLVYMNFLRNVPRTPNPREGLYEEFLKYKWVTGEGGFDHVPMANFYMGMASHAYVLSPPGAGPDCHRHWESILLGSIPIVLRSKATQILEDQPCFLVDCFYKEVTEENLLAQLPAFRKKMIESKDIFLHRVLDPGYWSKRIQDAAYEGGAFK